MSIAIIILAAGLGTRMRSSKPKMLQPIAGKPLLQHIVETAGKLNPEQLIVVCGQDRDQLQSEINRPNVQWVEQSTPLGTAHAVAQALPLLTVEQVLIWYGDIPLMQQATLEAFLANRSRNAIGLITARVEDPKGLGRIIRNERGVCIKIVEEKEANLTEQAVQEINTGFFLVPTSLLKQWLPKVLEHHEKHEQYLTDLVEIAAAESVPCITASPQYLWEVAGVNDKCQLAELERTFQRYQAEQLMRSGVSILDPNRFDLRGSLQVGKDVVIDVNVVLAGEVTLGNGVEIGPNVMIRDSVIGEGVKIAANSIIEEAQVGAECRIGPYARLRPETILSHNVGIGNFVEVKKSTLGAGTKANHLSYIGDATIGSQVNIGAGVITCNFDGKSKHPTTIGDRVFVGSDTQLIAPIDIQSDVIIGAGTTVTRNLSKGVLVHNRVEHRVVELQIEEVKE